MLTEHFVARFPVSKSGLFLGVMFGFLGLLLAVPIVAVFFVTVKMVFVEVFLKRQAEVKGESEARNKS